MSEMYTCAQCCKTYVRGWSDEEAAAEAEELWGITDLGELGVDIICDDCFAAVLASAGPTPKTLH